jgi:hypothetical protein
LGDTMKKCNPAQWISPDGSCGCAFGGALLAAGVSAEQFYSEFFGTRKTSELPCVKARWPWLTGEHLVQISQLYWNVYYDSKAIYDVAAYVRSVEPQEPIAPQVQDADLLLEVGL